MTSDRDIYISANKIINQHGDDALEHSMMMLARMVDVDDVEGGVTWGRIQRAIIELENTDAGTVN